MTEIWPTDGVRILVGDVFDRLGDLPDESVHCVVTSPPYWGLRDYGQPGQLGREPTPDEYVANMVAVFREVRRVLRRDGTCWLNLGDSYNNRSVGRKSSHQGGLGFESEDLAKSWATLTQEGRTRLSIEDGDLKEKDLVGVPWMVAFALRADGWYLRADVIWSKPNPMPESVTDRPTKSHEYLFLLTRSTRYFFDQEAVREPHTESSPAFRTYAARGVAPTRRPYFDGAYDAPGTAQSGLASEKAWRPNGRNVRSVWEIATQPYPDAHFATFPEELARRCILAGTSERGCCPECGAPWVREVERTVKVLGETWKPSCDHGHDTVPSVCLDPFGGSGTTAVVAKRLGRAAILVELSPDYADLARKRVERWYKPPARPSRPPQLDALFEL